MIRPHPNQQVWWESQQGSRRVVLGNGVRLTEHSLREFIGRLNEMLLYMEWEQAEKKNKLKLRQKRKKKEEPQPQPRKRKTNPGYPKQPYPMKQILESLRLMKERVGKP
jgi:hypothetical protein